MKSLVLALAMLLPVFCNAQNSSDTLSVLCRYDDMDEKYRYYASYAFYFMNEDTTRYVVMNPVISSDRLIIGLSSEMVNLGRCVDKATLIMMFSDSTKLNLKSITPFNCKGKALFLIPLNEIKNVTSKPIIKIRIQNGETFEQLTKVLDGDYQNYFVKLHKMLVQKNFVRLPNK